jgi:hypothetical protein
MRKPYKDRNPQGCFENSSYGLYQLYTSHKKLQEYIPKIWTCPNGFETLGQTSLRARTETASKSRQE